jgi:hypothetical protein
MQLQTEVFLTDTHFLVGQIFAQEEESGHLTPGPDRWPQAAVTWRLIYKNHSPGLLCVSSSRGKGVHKFLSGRKWVSKLSPLCCDIFLCASTAVGLSSCLICLFQQTLGVCGGYSFTFTPGIQASNVFPLLTNGPIDSSWVSLRANSSGEGLLCERTDGGGLSKSLCTTALWRPPLTFHQSSNGLTTLPLPSYFCFILSLPHFFHPKNPHWILFESWAGMSARSFSVPLL